MYGARVSLEVTARFCLPDEISDEQRNWFQVVVCFLLGNSPASEFFYADGSEHSVCPVFTGR